MASPLFTASKPSFVGASHLFKPFFPTIEKRSQVEVSSAWPQALMLLPLFITSNIADGGGDKQNQHLLKQPAINTKPHKAGQTGRKAHLFSTFLACCYSK